MKNGIVVLVTLMCLMVMAAGLQAGVVYRETFPTGPDAKAGGWQYFIDEKCWNASSHPIFGNAPGAGDLPPVNSKPASTDANWRGFVYLPVGASYLFFTDEFTVNEPVIALGWHMGLGGSGDGVHPAVRVQVTGSDGKVMQQWYVSQLPLVQDEKDRATPINKTNPTRFKIEGSLWRKLTVQPPTSPQGGKLGLEGTESFELPSGPMTAFGLYCSKRTANHTFDTFTVETAGADAAAAREQPPAIPAFAGAVVPVAIKPVTLPDAGQPMFGNVVIAGGGYMTGIYPSRISPGVAYLTSDMVGPWRRSGHDQPWELLTVTSTFNPPTTKPAQPGNGVSGIALHPTQPHIVFADMGAGRVFGSASGLYKSTDDGRSFHQVVDAYSASNSDAGPPATGSRKWGPSVFMQVNQPDIMYYATRRDGLFRSSDGGDTWVNVFKPGKALRNVVADPTGRVFVFAFNDGMYVSRDGVSDYQPDAGFNALLGKSKAVTWLRIADDGVVFAAHGDRIARFDPIAERWSDVTPDIGLGDIEAVAVHVGDSNKVIATRSEPGFGRPKYLLRSTDSGRTWQNAPVSHPYNEGWQADHGFKFNMAPAAVEIDPINPSIGYCADVFGIWQTDDLWAATVAWKHVYRGAENTVTLELTTVPAKQNDPQPAVLISGVSDIRGFVHTDVHQVPVRGYIMAPQDWSTYVTSADFVENDPSIMYVAKSLGIGGAGARGLVLRSTNGGKNWDMLTRPLPNESDAGGKLAVSATNKGMLVYAPSNSRPLHYSHDGGSTWQVAKTSEGQPAPWLLDRVTAYAFAQVLAADRVDGQTFYAYAWGGDAKKGPTQPGLWVSRDGGVTWSMSATVLPGANPYDSVSPVMLETVPGGAGEFYLALGGGGLWQSRDFGATLQKIETIPAGRPLGVAVGAAEPRETNAPATVYAYAKLASPSADDLHPWAFYRSTDGGQSWQVLPDKVGYTRVTPMIFAADRQVFGRVYLGTPGIGIWYLDTAGW